MNSREMMRRFFAGEPVDRVPNGLGACETAGVHVLAYENLKSVLGVSDAGNRMYTFMSNLLHACSASQSFAILRLTRPTQSGCDSDALHCRATLLPDSTPQYIGAGRGARNRACAWKSSRSRPEIPRMFA